MNLTGFTLINDVYIPERPEPQDWIHIDDSDFCTPDENISVTKGTEEYYDNPGFPEMTDHYFHHDINDPGTLNYEILYDPFSPADLFPGNSNPFTRACIKQNND
jgi:hypothetical protein